MESAQPHGGTILLVDLLPDFRVRFYGSTVRGVLHRNRVAAALLSLPGEEHRISESGRNGVGQMKNGRVKIQGRRDPVSVGTPCYYCGRALGDLKWGFKDSYVPVSLLCTHDGMVHTRCVLERHSASRDEPMTRGPASSFVLHGRLGAYALI